MVAPRGENRTDCFYVFDLGCSCNAAKIHILVMSQGYYSLVICKMGIMLRESMSSSVPVASPGSVLGPSRCWFFRSLPPCQAPLGLVLADKGQNLDSLSHEGHSEPSWASRTMWFGSKGNTLHSLPSLVCFALCFPGTFRVCCRGNVCSLWAWHLVGTR